MFRTTIVRIIWMLNYKTSIVAPTAQSNDDLYKMFCTKGEFVQMWNAQSENCLNGKCGRIENFTYALIAHSLFGISNRFTNESNSPRALKNYLTYSHPFQYKSRRAVFWSHCFTTSGIPFVIFLYYNVIICKCYNCYF